MKYLDRGGFFSEDTGQQEAFCFMLYGGFSCRYFICKSCSRRLYCGYRDSGRLFSGAVRTDGNRYSRIFMVCGIFKAGSGPSPICSWMYEAKEGRGGGIHCLDRLFGRHDSGNGSYEDGGKGNYPVPVMYGSAVYLLYCRISDAFVVFIRISGGEVEYIKDCMFFLIYAYRDSAGMLCESGDCKDVFKDAVRAGVYSIIPVREPSRISENK